MKEFVEKLIGRLLFESSGCKIYKLINPNKEDIVEFNAYKKCIEIVNQLADEYNNGWIPVSERLPDDFMSMAYLTTVKGHFYPEVKYYCVANHKWYSNERTTKEVKVIAWMPLPVAYQKGE